MDGDIMKHIELPDLFMRDLKHIFPVFDLIKNGLVLTDANSKILYVNPFYTEVTGYSKDEVLGKSPGMIRSGHHDELFYADMWKKIQDSGFWEGEVWNRNKSGRVYPSLLTITKIQNVTSKECNYLGIFSDITFLETKNAAKINLAFYDCLTKLPNRLFLQEHFSKMIKSFKREIFENAAENHVQPTLAIVFFDLNRFKQVNDQHGHVVGDKLLKMIAERLQGITRGSDIIVRFGGDEFVALLPRVQNTKNVDIVCKRINQVFAVPFCIDGLDINISCSIGVSIYPDDAETFESLIDKADKEMYQAKLEWLQSN